MTEKQIDTFIAELLALTDEQFEKRASEDHPPGKSREADLSAAYQAIRALRATPEGDASRRLMAEAREILALFQTVLCAGNLPFDAFTDDNIVASSDPNWRKSS